jgi:hypothetical protein
VARRVTQTPPTTTRVVVEVVRFSQSANVITIGPESPCWEDLENALEYHRDAEDAFVRVRPPAGASDAAVAQVVAAVKRIAVAVRADPRPRAAVVPESSHAEPAPVAASARAVVLQLVAESHSSGKKALSDLCEQIMGCAGL